MEKSVFKNIDARLEEVAINLKGNLEKDRPDYPESLRNFEERRIYWKDDDVSQGIIIQPTFESKGVNSEIWNFVITSFHWKKGDRSSYIADLESKVKFHEIENKLEALINEAIQRLRNLKATDYKLF